MTAVSSRASHGRATALDPAGSATELDDAFLEQVRERLLAEGGAITDTRIATAVRETGRVLGAVGAVKAAQHVKAQLTGLGPLEPLLPASGLSDLYVNGHENVFVETLGRIQRVASPFASEAQLRALAVRLVTAAGRRLDDGHPCVDVQTAAGLRVHAVIPPVSTGGTLLSIRFRAPQRLSLADLVASGTVHANSARAVPARLAALGSLAGLSREAVDLQASSALDLVAHVDRRPAGRRLTEVCVLALEDGVLRTLPALTTTDGHPVQGPGWPRLAQLLARGRELS